MKGIPGSILTLTAGIVVTLFSLWIGQNNHLMPEQASLQAPYVDSLFNIMVSVAAALFLVVEGAIIYFAFRYRKPQGDESDGIPVEGNLPLEMFWTVIPAIIVIGLGTYSVEVFQEMGGFGMSGHHGMMASAPKTIPALMQTAEDGSELTHMPIYGLGASPKEEGIAPELEVNVSGVQFAWLFDYPTQGITAGELHVPINTDVQLNLSAQDVIHSFWVPQFRIKQDAIPGQNTELRFTATKLGTYPVVCAELCGSYHGAMRSAVVVETPEAFKGWLEENQVAQAGSKTLAAAHTIPVNSAFADTQLRHWGVSADTLASLHPAHHNPLEQDGLSHQGMHHNG